MIPTWGNERPRNIELKELEDEFTRKFIRQNIVQGMHRIKMPKYLCDECQKNYWTHRILVGQNMNKYEQFKVCDLCNAHVRETCRRYGLKYQVLVMRRTNENSKDVDKLLKERYG